MANRARQPIFVAILVCAAFTSVASTVVLALDLLGHIDGPANFTAGLIARVAVFAIIAGAISIHLVRNARDLPATTPEYMRANWRFMLVPCVLAGAIAFPRLGATPHVEPDEWHHLNVARNLAEHGLYASGTSETGFIMFDDYDSVGPPVIVPVAAAMRVFGPELETARLVMACFFVALAAVVFAIVAPMFGNTAGVCSAVLIVGAWGSAYLGRALYGEVPALLFWLLAMIAARRSIRDHLAWRWAALAGLCFGLSVLTKYYMLMTIWPLMGVLVFDGLHAKRFNIRHVAAGAIGAVITIGAWPLVQSFAARDVTSATGGQLSLYKHNLLFGVEGLGATTGFLTQQPLALAALGVALGYGWWTMSGRSTDPSWTALCFFAAFQWYWWLFFNTGNLPRYSWYGWAAAAILLGPAISQCATTVLDTGARPMLIRTATAVVCLLIVIPSVRHIGFEMSRAWRSDEMASTRELASYVATRPAGDRVGAAFWPLERSVPYLSGKNVERVRTREEAEAFDVVLLHTQAGPEWRDDGHAKRFGPYLAVTK